MGSCVSSRAPIHRQFVICQNNAIACKSAGGKLPNGVAYSLFSLGISVPIVTNLWTLGTTITNGSTAASAWLWSNNNIGNIQRVLSNAATRARDTVGNGRGPVYGTRVHNALKYEVENLSRNDLWTEVSYKNQKIVDYGTKGSIRIDVVFGSRENPTALFDLKTGNAFLSGERINEIRSHLPFESQGIPIIELKP